MTMKKILKIEIECGEKTCAIEPKKFCHYFGTVKFGSIPTCCLFPSKDKDRPWTDLKEVDGWAMRCADCLKAETAYKAEYMLPLKVEEINCDHEHTRPNEHITSGDICKDCGEEL
jgi:hypothetical protein